MFLVLPTNIAAFSSQKGAESLIINYTNILIFINTLSNKLDLILKKSESQQIQVL